MSGPDAVRAFFAAFNAEDVDALAATLTPDVEIQTSRGLVEGHEEARRWATRNPAGYLHQRLVVDEVRDAGAHVLAFARRQWWWREDRKVADETELIYVATIRGGLICRLQPYEDRDEALRAAGVAG